MLVSSARALSHPASINTCVPAEKLERKRHTLSSGQLLRPRVFQIIWIRDHEALKQMAGYL
ncbi:hypothetical protein C6558_23575 [Ensifer sp. NM-2]|nr:hypothetical protein C6558_23575 [Ensifer sp. NM-2]